MIAGLTGGIVIGACRAFPRPWACADGTGHLCHVPHARTRDAGCIYAGAIYGGANSAILICTPGTPSSVATPSTAGLSARTAKRIRRSTPPCFPRPSAASSAPFFFCFWRARWPASPELRRTGKLLALPFRAKHHRGHDAREHGQRHCLRRHRPAGVHHRLDPNTGIPRFTFDIYGWCRGYPSFPV